jgi:hypothetical protein
MALFSCTIEDLDETVYVVVDVAQEAIDLIFQHFFIRCPHEVSKETITEGLRSHDAYTVIEERDL